MGCMQFVRPAFRILGFVALLPSALKAGKWLVGLGGDIDFVISRSQEPGWVGDMTDWLIDPPSWLHIPLMVLGFALIWWGVRKDVPRSGFPRRKWRLRRGGRKRDASLVSAYWYLLDQRWHTEEGTLSNVHTTGYDVHAALKTIEQAAHDEMITIWGKRDGIYTKIPFTFWASNGIIIINISKLSGDQDHNSFCVVRKGADTGDGYKGLMCSKAEFERIDWEGYTATERESFLRRSPLGTATKTPP